MTLLRQSLKEIYAPIEKELANFSAHLRRELSSQDELIRQIHDHILMTGGKFIRPALALLCARAGGSDTCAPEAIKLAAAVELIHTATLVHDDIIDHSAFRRNQPTVPSRWGHEISIVSGDYLYAKAFMLLADLQNPWISRAFAACAHTMCEGEMKQIECRAHYALGEGEYLRIIQQKTAALFQAACAGGAYYSGLDRSRIEKLGDYGYRLGMAFQIVDDCLDLTGRTQDLGKETGLDILKNDVTLPIVYLLQDLEALQRERILKALKEPSSGILERIRSLAMDTKSVERAMEKAQGFIEAAVADLQEIPASVIRDSLAALANYCVERIR